MKTYFLAAVISECYRALWWPPLTALHLALGHHIGGGTMTEIVDTVLLDLVELILLGGVGVLLFKVRLNLFRSQSV